uniref:Uncharacterized protein n=1 Tax=Pipistrellus kuhlii TaxID=59472 RepID=A0A7J7T2A8_PIPKU|nr:hypothetical protein mPipKuh1_009700 [Pipistrellus kuhlii]
MVFNGAHHPVPFPHNHPEGLTKCGLMEETETKTVTFHLETKIILWGLVQKKGGREAVHAWKRWGCITRQFDPSAPASWACALPPRPSVAQHPDLPGYGGMPWQPRGTVTMIIQAQCPHTIAMRGP